MEALAVWWRAFRWILRQLGRSLLEVVRLGLR